MGAAGFKDQGRNGGGGFCGPREGGMEVVGIQGGMGAVGFKDQGENGGGW